MMPAAKHFDPVLGIDIHIIQPPGPVPPVPVPHPFIGFIMDPMDYIPIVGSTVNINFLPRALAGTQGVCMPPHIPIGGVFVKPPANECEMFMGSATVNVDGDAQSYLGLPALSCHCIGMPPIPRIRKKGAIKSLVLPTSNVLPIPAGPPVLVGGPPTISLMAMAMKLGMSALGAAFKKFMKTKAGRAIGKKVDDIKSKFKKKTPPHNKACGRTGEPVDVVTGANVDSFIDFDHPLYPALEWTRFYSSLHCDLDGPMGFGFRHGWQHELRFLADRVEYRLPDGDIVELPLPAPAAADEKNASGPVVFQSEHDGIQLTGSSNSYWKLTAAYWPSLVFSSPQRGVCRLQSIQSTTRSIEINYDERGRMIGGHADDGTVLELELDVQGRIREVTLVDTRDKKSIAVYQYDRAGCLAEWTDAVGNTSRYEFDANKRMARKVDRNGYAYHYEYDDAGRCFHSFGQDGLYDVRLEYFPEDCYTVATFADGAETEYHYDESGALTKIINATGGVTLFEIDESGNVSQQIDPNSDATEYIYNSMGGNLGRIDASGQWLFPFDLQPHRPYGLAYQLPASPEGWIAGNQSPTSLQQTDSMTSLTAAIASVPIKLKKPMERVVESEDEFDLQGRVTQTRSKGTKRQRVQTFDRNGNLASRIDEDGVRWSYRYTSWNLLEEERSPLGSAIQYKYNLREAVTSVKDGGGTETVYELDACDRLTAVHRGGQLRERYVYNNAGGLIEKYDRNGARLLTLEPGPYDTHAVIELKNGPRIEFKYDELARVVAANDGTCQLARKYSPSGRLVADMVNGRGVERKSPAANLDRIEVLRRFPIQYEQRSDGSVQLTDPTGQQHTLRRDSVGRFAIETSNCVKQWMAFDDRGQLVSHYVGGLAEGDWWRTYDYTPVGNLQRIEDSRNGKTEYRYDAAHRLVGQIDERGREQQFAYDTADNLLVQPGLTGVKVGVANQLERTSDEQFEYNARMHLSKRHHVDGTTTEYTYDSLDRLTRIRRSDGLDWHADYDPLGRRIAKYWTAPDESQHRVDFYWDEHRLAGELLDGKQLRLYLYADDTALSPILIADYDSPTAKTESGRIYQVLHDQRGQPIDVRDNNGESVWQAIVAPFGAVQKYKPSEFTMPIRMPGHYEDLECRLFSNRHRYYDPALARYIQSDPLGLGGSLNTFAYLTNPLIDVDLEGLHPSAASQSPKKAAGTPTQEVTPRAARREAMRQQGIPTSQQPKSQSRNASGREYQYERPKPGGGTETKSVQQQTLDSSHPGQGHFEAGTIKTDPDTGQPRMNNYGRPKLQNDKSKVDYDG